MIWDDDDDGDDDDAMAAIAATTIKNGCYWRPLVAYWWATWSFISGWVGALNGDALLLWHLPIVIDSLTLDLPIEK